MNGKFSIDAIKTVLKKISYYLGALKLFITRKISFETIKLIIRTKPIAVCGKGGSYALENTFEDNADADKE